VVVEIAQSIGYALGFSDSIDMSGVKCTKGQDRQRRAIYGWLSIGRSYFSVRVIGAEQLQEKSQYIIKL